MKLQLEAVFEEQADDLLELLRSLNFGMIGSGGVYVEGLVVYPARRAGHAVIVGGKGDAEEGSDGGSGGDEASVGKDTAVGGFIAGEPVRVDGDDFKPQGSLGYRR